MAKQKRPPARVLWFSCVISGTTWRVFLVDVTQIPEMQDLEGWTKPWDTSIYLDRSLPPDKLHETLVHELLHAIHETSGINQAILDVLNLDHKTGDRFEELITRLLSPVLIDTLRRNGWLTLPRIPTGRS